MKPRADYETAVLIMREETEGWGKSVELHVERHVPQPLWGQ